MLTTFDARFLKSSVIAVPPLARNSELQIDREANATLIRYIEAGGVRSLLYGGNANFYNVGVAEYGAILDLLAELAGPDTLVIPSAGPDFGKLLDQLPLLKERPFPTVMVLPLRFPATQDGAQSGIRQFAEGLGRPIVLYLKDEDYLDPERAADLVEDGLVAAIKYAIVRPQPAEDTYLKRLLERVDCKMVVSGMGERPAMVHMREFKLAGFTSGSVCVGPQGSQQMLEAINAGRFEEADKLRSLYMPLEDLRDSHSPIRVLHEAVTLAGIADMGPMLPLLSNIDEDLRGAVKQAAVALRVAQESHG